MSVACSLKLLVLCVQLGFVDGSGVTLHTGGPKGLGSVATIEPTEGWRISYPLFTDVVTRFYPVGAEHVCVKDLCIDYHRKCKKNGQATICTYVINDPNSSAFTVTADNDAAWNAAMNKVAIFRTVAATSDFPLALFDKDTNP